jgi:tetratricopeptide (TPR) repeat protein
MHLLERQEQLDELARLLREAGKNAGKVAFVRGEAGAGKSSLVEEFASCAAGAPIYWGHCDALQTSRVLGPVKELAAEAGSAPDSDLPRDKLFSRLFEQFSPPNPPCVVVLEDLHWADEATLDFVRFVGRRIQRTRCLVVATFRDDEVGSTHPLRSVLGELTGQHVARIAVPPLSLAAVEQLAEGTRCDAGHIHRVSEGNPFFVRELLSAPLDTIPETGRALDRCTARFWSTWSNAMPTCHAWYTTPCKPRTLIRCSAMRPARRSRRRSPARTGKRSRTLRRRCVMPKRAAQANALLLLGRGYWKSGKADLARRHIADAIALLENGPESRDLAMAYSMHSQLAMTADSTEEALSYGQRALDLATRFEDHEVRAHALNNLGCALLNASDFSGVEKMESSLAVALEHNLQDHAGRAYANLVSSLVRQHCVELATHYISEGAAYAELHEVQDTVVYIRAYVAQFELDRGRWEKAAQMAAELLQHPSLAIPPRIPTLVALASVRARRGDPGVDLLLDEALRLALPTAESQRIGPVAALRAEVAWYRGELGRAAQEAALGLKAAEGRNDRWVNGQLAYGRTEPRRTQRCRGESRNPMR